MQERTRPGRAGHGSAKISVPLTAGGYRPQGAGGGWLWVIARRQAALWLRRRGRAAGLIAALTQAEDPAGGDPAEVASSRTDLAAAVEALGPPGGART